MSYTIECKFKARTANAIKIVDKDSGEELWFPLTQVEQIHGCTENHTGEGTIVVSDWIANKKGLG